MTDVGYYITQGHCITANTLKCDRHGGIEMNHGILKVVGMEMLKYGCESVISRADSSKVWY